jgi:glycosyltransferase involved in cell wall biosynthesis
LLPPLLSRLRKRDLAAASGPDVFVANSQHVSERIARYYGRPATVVHPPVDVEPLLTLSRDERDYYLIFGRVVPYKRVDLAVAACIRMDRPLKVAGDGRGLAAVRAVARTEAATAGRTARVEFLGRVDDRERDRLLEGARALLFPGEEDFGIVPVEAQAAGVPVIAYGIGGARESVLDGQTGVLFDGQNPDGVGSGIERFEQLRLDPRRMRENAKRFGPERFRREMAEVIDSARRTRDDVGT